MKKLTETIAKEVKNGFNILKNTQTLFLKNINSNDLLKSQKKYHIHFGAGKLGLGLVIPKYLKRNLIIIQRPSVEWKVLQTHSKIKFVLNDRSYYETFFIHQDSELLIETFNRMFSNGDSFLLCSDDSTIIKHLLISAESISTSLGLTGLSEIIPFLEGYNSNKKLVNVYPFENDPSPLNSLKNKKLNIIPLVADKICNDRKFYKDSILIKAEEFEEVYLFASNRNVNKEIHPVNINIIIDIEEFNFFKRRKLYIVNGLHMTAALFGYDYLKSRKIPIKEWGSRYLSEVMGYQKLAENLEIFAIIQSLRLIIETDPIVLAKIYKSQSKNYFFEQIFSYGKNIIENRFNYSLDHLDRLLQIDSANFSVAGKKIEDRIEKIVKFIKEDRSKINNLLPEIISIKINREDLLDAIVSLQSSISSFLKTIMYLQKS